MIKLGREKPRVEHSNSIRTKNTMKICIVTEEREGGNEREIQRKGREREREKETGKEKESERERNRYKGGERLRATF